MNAAPKQLTASLAVTVAMLSGCTAPANDDGTSSSGAPSASASAAEAATSGISEDDLREGECMTDFGTAAEPEIRLIPCSEPHAFEVFAVTELADGSYPGIGEADAQAQEFCRAEFLDFVGVEYDASVLELQYFYPVESEWSDDGGRSVICLVGRAGSEPSSGTLRDADQ